MAGVLRVPSLLYVRVQSRVSSRCPEPLPAKRSHERENSLWMTPIRVQTQLQPPLNLEPFPFSSLNSKQPPTDQGDAGQAERAVAGPHPGLLQARKGKTRERNRERVQLEKDGRVLEVPLASTSFFLSFSSLFHNNNNNNADLRALDDRRRPALREQGDQS